MSPNLRYVDETHPLQRVNSELKAGLLQAQSNLLDLEMSSAGELCERAFADLRIVCRVPKKLYDVPISAMAEQSYAELNRFFFRPANERRLPGA